MRAPATFFLIERHLSIRDGALHVQRIAAEGHGVALHSHTRAKLFLDPDELGRRLTAFAHRLGNITGQPACRAFRRTRERAGKQMLEGLGAGSTTDDWMGLLAVGFRLLPSAFRPHVPRPVRHASAGDIVVIHDGHHVDPRANRLAAIEITRALIPALRAKGFNSA